MCARSHSAVIQCPTADAASLIRYAVMQHTHTEITESTNIQICLSALDI
jgi:hypothetical protein